MCGGEYVTDVTDGLTSFPAKTRKWHHQAAVTSLLSVSCKWHWCINDIPPLPHHAPCPKISQGFHWPGWECACVKCYWLQCNVLFNMLKSNSSKQNGAAHKQGHCSTQILVPISLAERELTQWLFKHLERKLEIRESWTKNHFIQLLQSCLCNGMDYMVSAMP